MNSARASRGSRSSASSDSPPPSSAARRSRKRLSAAAQLVFVDAVAARERADSSEPIVEPCQASRIRLDAVAVVLKRRLDLPQLDLDARQRRGRRRNAAIDSASLSSSRRARTTAE